MRNRPAEIELWKARVVDLVAFVEHVGPCDACAEFRRKTWGPLSEALISAREAADGVWGTATNARHWWRQTEHRAGFICEEGRPLFKQARKSMHEKMGGFSGVDFNVSGLGAEAL